MDRVSCSQNSLSIDPLAIWQSYKRTITFSKIGLDDEEAAC